MPKRIIALSLFTTGAQRHREEEIFINHGGHGEHGEKEIKKLRDLCVLRGENGSSFLRLGGELLPRTTTQMFLGANLSPEHFL
jgi:hypothetical protein